MPNPSPSLTARLRSWAYWVYLVLTTVLACTTVMALWVLVRWWLDRRRRSMMWVMRLWSRAIFSGNPLYRIEVEGLEHIERGRTYVVASNHQSYGDIFVLGYVPVPYVYLSKREIFFIPFAGWGMWLVGCIPLRRGDKESARRATAACVAKLREGVSVLIFPEGTRSADGNLGPFKEGAFRMAVEGGRDVLPVVIDGSRDILPKGSFGFTQPAHIRIAVLPAVSAADATEADVPALLAETRSRIAAKLAELRARRD